MGLEDILKSIDEKVNQELEKIRKEAEEEKKKILERAREEAEQHKEKILRVAKKNLEDEKRRKLIQIRREEKKETLRLKRKIMDEIFQEAKEKFLNLDKQEYLSLMKEVLLTNLSQGEVEIIISPRDKKLMDKSFIQEVEKSLSEKKVKLRFLPQLDEGERGFIIKEENLEINCTLSSLFSAVKDKIEIEVAHHLFG